ncbi:sugar ABC transporter substrate-binding protein [Acidisoma cellulosilytica]|uniref:Sugar ABC transporter substrate-binding protein n=1 Tax=Acidisoma cellulosilyticum TaxID=2802395 RepID=A0A964E4I9_9PROT|nr:sugar ABC transporter substrate-binding protein [Acidisoma cellulosilyticum]MCB8881534.1 sugar ABC transporter substrate-binding protein [Acidisoma cellulosilyticum]
MKLRASLLAFSVLCSFAIPAAHADSAKPYAGQTISVLLPPWGTLPKAMTDSFTAETGIKIDMQTQGWDQIHAKILTAMIANNAPADVTEVDWSWVGQFGAAGWYVPLQGKVSADVVKDVASSKIFTTDGNLIAMPYNNDFRVLIVNKAMFDKAGITSLPTTMDELWNDAVALKKSGVTYPIALPLSANEGTSTAWYLMTKAFGGDLFDAQLKPEFTTPDSAGYKALDWIVKAVKAGLIDPASTGLTDVQVQAFLSGGQAAIDLAGWAGNLTVYNDPTKSKVAGHVEAVLMPSATGHSRSFGLPEALGIPANAAHKDAALAFIDWWMKPATQIEAYTALGDLPTSTAALSSLSAAGKIPSGDVLLKQIPTVEPLFAQGTPEWYPQFSAGVSSAINEAAKGQLTVAQAIAQIAAQAQKAKSQ